MKIDPNLPFSVVSRGDQEVNEVIVPEKPENQSAANDAGETETKPNLQTQEPEQKEPVTATRSQEPEKQTSAQQKPSEKPKEEAEDKTAPKEPKKPEPTFEEIIAQKTGGKYKSFDDVLTDLNKPHENKFKDDYIKKIVDYYESTGSLKPVLEALSTDWSKVSDEDMFRQDIKERYPNLSAKALQKVYQKEIIAKYNLDEDQYEPEDVEFGKELFAHDAQKLREAKVKQQAEFKMPEPQQPANAPSEVDIQKQKDASKAQLKTDPATSELLNNKRVVVPYDGGEFNFEVDNPESFLDMAIDPNKVYAPFITDGKPDLGKFYRAMAYANNEEKFIQTMKTHFKSIGTEEVLNEIKNKQEPQTTNGNVPEAEDKDPRVGLLKTFAKKGVHT